MPELMNFLKNLFNAENAQKIVKHVQQNKTAYTAAAAGTAAAGVGYVAYKAGKNKGHTEGKKEGVAEQAKRDCKKFRRLEEAHNADREKWKKLNKEKDELINDLGEQLHH